MEGQGLEGRAQGQGQGQAQGGKGKQKGKKIGNGVSFRIGCEGQIPPMAQPVIRVVSSNRTKGAAPALAAPKK